MKGHLLEGKTVINKDMYAKSDYCYEFFTVVNLNGTLTLVSKEGTQLPAAQESPLDYVAVPTQCPPLNAYCIACPQFKKCTKNALGPKRSLCIACAHWMSQGDEPLHCICPRPCVNGDKFKAMKPTDSRYTRVKRAIMEDKPNE